MHFTKVLAECLAGCGLNPDSVRQGKRQRTQSRRFQALPTLHPEDTDLGAMLRAGPHVMGELLCHHSLPEAVERARSTSQLWVYDPHVLASLTCLGEALQARAIRCLPVQFDVENREYCFLDKLTLPLTPEQLAQTWRGGDRKTRLQVAKLLAATFVTAKEDRVSYEADRRDQPAERVLPARYGRWHLRRGSRANCLGKAIMVAGFAKMAQARALAVIPTRLSCNEERHHRGLAARICLEELEAANVPLSRGRRRSLESVVGSGRSADRDVSWLHMSIAMDMGKGEWVLVDPNMGMASVIPETWEGNDAYETLIYCEQVLPGLSLLRQIPDSRSRFQGYLELTQLNCSVLNNFAQLGFSKTATKEEIIARLVQSELLDHILTWIEFSKTELDPNAPRPRKALSALMEFNYDLSKERICGMPARKCLWFVFGDWPYEKLLSELTDIDARRALLALCFEFAVRGIRLLDKEESTSRWTAEQMHPQCQLSLAGSGLACSALAHVALASGKRASRAVEQLLNQHCFDLYRLHVSAGRLLVDPQNAGQEALRSASILRRLPFRLPSSEHVLGQLDSERIVSIPSTKVG